MKPEENTGEVIQKFNLIYKRLHEQRGLTKNNQ
jgi:hypothetical protein